VDLTWHPNGTLSYRQKKLFYFERSLSHGDEEDQYVLANIPLLVSDKNRYRLLSKEKDFIPTFKSFLSKFHKAPPPPSLTTRLFASPQMFIPTSSFHIFFLVCGEICFETQRSNKDSIISKPNKRHQAILEILDSSEKVSKSLRNEILEGKKKQLKVDIGFGYF